MDCQDLKIGFIGGGNMAQALATSFIKKDTASKEENKSRHYLNLEERKRIIEYINSAKERGEKINCTHLAKEYNVSDRTIRRIRDDVDIKSTRLEHVKSLPCFSKRKKVLSENFMEYKLYEWFKEKRDIDEPISGGSLKEKALIINRSIGGDKDFKATTAWLHRFKYRYGIRCSNENNRLSCAAGSSKLFKETLNHLIITRNLKLHEIYNADETGLYWKSLPNGTFSKSNETNAADNNINKERVSVMMCVNANGSHKIPLFVIGKSENPGDFKDLDVNKMPVKYLDQSKAWMERNIFKQWYVDVFLPAVYKEQQERNETYKVLLILDNAHCPLSKEELDAIDDICTVEFIPSNATALIQPMNQGITEHLKNLYRKSYLKELLLQEKEEDIINFIAKRNIKTCCLQLANAWNKISPLNVRQSWRKLISKSDNFKTTHFDVCLVDDYLQLLFRIPGFSNLTPEDITHWLKKDENDPGWQALTESEITRRDQDDLEDNLSSDFSSVKEEILKVQSEDLPLHLEAMEALKAFETYKKWFEKRTECESTHLLFLQSLNELTNDIVSHLRLEYTPQED